ncbi:MAG: P-loop NTPase [Bacteroidales bacterium]|jgi:MinD superfamily P-loop ATPase|nr:P-loop NTPase [Bacteroidales bacterium]
MKEITILSGKGGTGKTSVSAALASLAKDAIFCDNDVDAANLHLIFDPETKETEVFEGAYLATINPEICTQCGICTDYCRYDAISINVAKQHSVDPFKCEGCRLCERICPENAISSEKSTKNFMYVSDSRFGKFVHASMGPGEENSGKLVTKLRAKAKELSKETPTSWIINDGPPGIGCAAISSLSGIDHALLVTEPSKSGMHDLKRLIELIQSFKIPAQAIINKYSMNEEISSEIEAFLLENNIPVIAKIPFSKDFTHAMIEGKNIIEYLPDSEVSSIIRKAWTRIEIGKW